MRSLAASFLAAASLSAAHHFPLQSRSSHAHGQQKLINNWDLVYTTNITLGGEVLEVIIDTGSADLWVTPHHDKGIPNSAVTGRHVSLEYANGSVEGAIKAANLSFAGYDVEFQTFLEVPHANNNAQVTGIVGIGPSASSVIHSELQSAAGMTLLERIFREEMDKPNYITLLLGRTEDPTDTSHGSLTVGSLLEGFEDVEKQPKIDLDQSATHYQFLADEDSFIGPDGHWIAVQSALPGAPYPGKATVAISTSYSFTLVPKAMSDAFYSSFDGAELAHFDGEEEPWWILPCQHEVNILFKFGGVEIPIHPLDASINPAFLGLANLTTSAGHKACVGTFQPLTSEVKGYVDVLLGQSFLRNAYTYINVGDFLTGGWRGPWCIKFLSTTEAEEAHSDFVHVRASTQVIPLDGSSTSTSNAPVSSDSDLDLSGAAAVTGEETDDGYTFRVIKPVFIAICVVAGLLLLTAIWLAIALCRASRKKGHGYSYGSRGFKPLSLSAKDMEGYDDEEVFAPKKGEREHEEIFNAGGESSLYDPHTPRLGGP